MLKDWLLSGKLYVKRHAKVFSCCSAIWSVFACPPPQKAPGVLFDFLASNHGMANNRISAGIDCRKTPWAARDAAIRHARGIGGGAERARRAGATAQPRKARFLARKRQKRAQILN
jgi:hypothetical protein